MESSSNVNSNYNVGSQRLLALAQQLSLYKPPLFHDDVDEQTIEENGGKVVSQVGFPESTTLIAQNPEKFRPKRAAVLICLSEGDAGDLRVIVTKRSSKTLSHSGEVALPGGKEDEGDKDDEILQKERRRRKLGWTLNLSMWLLFSNHSYQSTY